VRELLKDAAGREHFRRFLEKEFSAENLKSVTRPSCRNCYLLSASTAVAGVVSSPSFVCLSVYPHDISEKMLQLGSPNLTR